MKRSPPEDLLGLGLLSEAVTLSLTGRFDDASMATGESVGVEPRLVVGLPGTSMYSVVQQGIVGYRVPEGVTRTNRWAQRQPLVSSHDGPTRRSLAPTPFGRAGEPLRGDGWARIEHGADHPAFLVLRHCGTLAL